MPQRVYEFMKLIEHYRGNTLKIICFSRNYKVILRTGKQKVLRTIKKVCLPFSSNQKCLYNQDWKFSITTVMATTQCNITTSFNMRKKKQGTSCYTTNSRSVWKCFLLQFQSIHSKSTSVSWLTLKKLSTNTFFFSAKRQIIVFTVQNIVNVL